jgi:hypothetical protein
MSAVAISLLGVGWQIFWSVYSHRKELHRTKERIRTTVAFCAADPSAKHAGPDTAGPEPQVKVSVYNASDFALSIQSVELVVRSGPESLRKWKFLSPHWEKTPIAGREESHAVLIGYRDFLDLPQRTSVTFELPVMTDALRRGIMDACLSKRCNVWIAISTHAGEIARIPGRQVILALTKFVNAYPQAVVGQVV